MKSLHIAGLLGLAAAGVVFLNSVFTVHQTQTALVLTLGKIEREIKTPGLHFKRPFVQQVVTFDNRVLALDSRPEEVVTQDKKRILVDTFLRWRIEDASVFYETQGTIVNAQSQLSTIMSSAAKRALAREDMDDIISGNREAIMGGMLGEIRREASRLGIHVLDVRIKRADLPQENSLAVFNRMRAERNKEATEIRAQGEEQAVRIRATAERERTVLIAEAERDAQILRGEGDAEAIRIYAEAYGKSPRFYNLSRTLDAYRNALARDGATLVIDPEMDFLQLMQSPNTGARTN